MKKKQKLDKNKLKTKIFKINIMILTINMKIKKI